MIPVVSPSIITNYFLEVNNGIITARDTIKVSPLTSVTPSVSITASETTICEGSSVTFIATPINQGNVSTYRWQVNDINTGMDSNVLTTNTLSNGDSVKVILTSSATCASPTIATSNVIKINVNSKVIPSVSISTPSTTVCPGSPVVFTATSVNGGSLPYYTWVKGGVVVQRGISNTYITDYILNGDQIWVTLTSNAECANPNTVVSDRIILSLASPVTPSVSVTATALSICSGTNVTFTATSVNGGNAPSYQWLKNGVSTGSNSNVYSSTNLINGDQIAVILPVMRNALLLQLQPVMQLLSM